MTYFFIMFLILFYKSKLLGFNKNSFKPITTIPSSVIQLFILSLTTIIFLKLSGIFND